MWLLPVFLLLYSYFFGILILASTSLAEFANTGSDEVSCKIAPITGPIMPSELKITEKTFIDILKMIFCRITLSDRRERPIRCETF